MSCSTTQDSRACLPRVAELILLKSRGTRADHCFFGLQVPIPEHMDMYHLCTEAEPSDRTALQAVVDHIEAEVAF